MPQLLICFFYLLSLFLATPVMGRGPVGPHEICPGAINTIVVNVHGIQNKKGKIAAVLYGEKPDDFLAKGKKLERSRVQAKNAKDGSVKVCLNAPQFGQYAVAVFHDENNNKKLDQNWVGLPTEGYGFSNNPKFFLAPPSHAQVAFEVINGHTTIDVQLHY